MSDASAPALGDVSLFGIASTRFDDAWAGGLGGATLHPHAAAAPPT